MASSVRRQSVSLASRFLLAIGAGLLLLTLLPAVSLAQGPVAAETDFAPREVSEYRQDFPGVSNAQAEAHLETQRKGAGIVNQLKRDLGPDYAGVWFDNEAGEFVVPLLPGANRGSIQAELAGAKLEDDYRTAPATHSWAELEAAQERIDEELQPLFEQRLVQTSLDPRTNAVIVKIAQGTSKTQRGEVQGLAAGGGVRMEVRQANTEQLRIELAGCKTSAPRLCDKPLRGGVGIGPDYAKEGAGYTGLCSAGFKAIGKYTGSRYVLTAGHCASWYSNWASEHTGEVEKPIGSVAEYSYPGGDWAKINANGSYWDTSPWPSQVAHFWGNQNTPIYYEAYTYLGQYVCHSGNSSGTSCGNVLELGVTSETGSGNINNVTIFGIVCSISGDSGGPAFAGNTALGLYHGDLIGSPPQKGNCPTESEDYGAYVEITDATDDLGVDVGTRIGGAPGADTDPATDIQPYQAKLNGQVNPNAVETFYRFEWGKSCYCQHTSEVSAGHGANWVSKSATISGLDPVTKYKFRIRAKSAAGTAYGSEAAFTTPPAPPKSTTEGHSNVRVEEETGKATLHGKINPGGADTDYRFEWDTVASGEFANSAPVPAGDAGDGIDYKSVQAGIEGLKGLTEYHYRLYAENSEGDDTGAVKKFTTPDWRPEIAEVNHGSVYVEAETGKVDIEAMIDPNGFKTTYHIEWGTDPEELVNSTSEVEMEYTGTAAQPIEATIEGIKGETTYHYRLVAENSEGTTESEVGEFTTPNWRPGIITEMATGIDHREATLHAGVNSSGFATTYRFEYGQSEEYGQSIPAKGEGIGSAQEYVAVSQGLEGLAPNAEYHFRVIAENVEGTITGKDQTFIANPSGFVALDSEGNFQPAILEGNPTAFQLGGQYGTMGCTGAEMLSEAPQPIEAMTVWMQGMTCQLATVTGSVHMYDCYFELDPAPTEGGLNGEFSIGPPGCGPVEFESLSCQLSIYPESGYEAKYATEEGEGELESTVTAELSTDRLKYSEDGGFHCGSGETRTDGYLEAEIEFSAEDIEAKPLDLEALSVFPFVPKVSTEPATEVTAHEALLNGTVNPDGAGTEAGETSYEFEYGTTTEYGSTAPGESVGSGSETVEVSEPIEGLGSGVKYHFRVAATNEEGVTAYGHDRTFTTIDLRPQASTDPATEVNAESATLNATVNPKGLATTYQFEYGTSTEYGSKAPASPEAIGKGEKDIAVEEPVEGLQIDTVYHYRIAATNAKGTVYGQDETFTTVNQRPVVETEAATGVSEAGEATLRGTVNPKGLATTYQFEYGTSTEYGSKAPVSPEAIGKGGTQVDVSEALEGLQGLTVYHYRLVASNAKGTTHGADRTFATVDSGFLTEDSPVSMDGAGAPAQHTLMTNDEIFSCEAPVFSTFQQGPAAALGPAEAEGQTCTRSASEVTMDMNGCQLTFFAGPEETEGEFAGALEIGPPGCGPIEIPPSFSGGCTLEIEPDELPAAFLNEAEGEEGEPAVRASIDVNEELEYTKSGLCSYPGPGSYEDGSWEGSWELSAADGGEEAVGLSVGDIPPMPKVTTKPATGVDSGAASEVTLNAKVNTEGTEGLYYVFEYGTDEEYGSWTEYGAVEGSGDVIVSEGLEFLQPQTTYHYRVFVIDETEEIQIAGDDETFTTPDLHTPRFEAEGYPVEASGEGEGPVEVFSSADGVWQCDESELSAPASGPTGELNLDVEYGYCYVNYLDEEEQEQERPAEADMNSCHYTLTAENAGPPYKGELGIECAEEGDAIEYRVYAFGTPEEHSFVVCTVEIGPQAGLGGTDLANQGAGAQRAVVAHLQTEGIEYDISGNCVEEAEERTDGEVDVEATLQGADEGEEQVGIYLAGEGLQGLYLSGEESESEASQPRFEADGYPKSIGGEGIESFATGLGTIACDDTSLAAEMAASSEALDLDAEYSYCYVDEEGEEGLPAEADMNSCHYTLTAENAGPPYKGELGIECAEEGDAIEYRVYAFGTPEEHSFLACTLELGPQQGLGGIGLENVGKASERSVEVSAEAEGIAYDISGSCTEEAEERTDGALIGETTLEGV